MFYNFVRIHQTLKITPAKAAGVTDKLWEVSDIVAMVEAWEADHAKHGTTYDVEQVAIGEGYRVRRIERYEPLVTEFFPTKEAAEAWIEADKASHRLGRKRKAAD